MNWMKDWIFFFLSFFLSTNREPPLTFLEPNFSNFPCEATTKRSVARGRGVDGQEFHRWKRGDRIRIAERAIGQSKSVIRRLHWSATTSVCDDFSARWPIENGPGLIVTQNSVVLFFYIYFLLTAGLFFLIATDENVTRRAIWFGDAVLRPFPLWCSRNVADLGNSIQRGTSETAANTESNSVDINHVPPPQKKKYPFFFFLFFLSFCMKMNRKTLQGTVEAIVSDDAAKFNAEFNCGRRRDGDRSPPITRWRHQRRRPNSKRSRPPRWMSSRNVQRLPEIQFFKKNKNEIKKNTNKNETQILPPRRIW